MKSLNIHSKILELNKLNFSFVLATIIKSSGSVPGKTGFKMIIEKKGNCFGTVGGGAIEKQVIDDAQEILKKGKNEIRDYLLSDKIKKSDKKNSTTIVPMKCNGKVSIFYEVYGQKSKVFIFGGGHVGNALLYSLKPLPFFTVLIDNRTEFANKEINADADEINHADYEEYAKKFKPAEDDFVVIVTHGHNFDFKILKILYERKLDLKYIGLIASQSKAREMITGIKKAFGKKINTDSIYSPIGLKIGGDSPSEIALSIAAEIQSVKNNKILIPQ